MPKTTSAWPWWVTRPRRPVTPKVQARLSAVLNSVATTRARPLARIDPTPPRTRAAKRPRCRAVERTPTPAKRITCCEKRTRVLFVDVMDVMVSPPREVDGSVSLDGGRARAGRRGHGTGQRLGEVVERRAADGDAGEVLLDPRRDLGGRAAAAILATEPAARSEIVDLSGGHVLLELRERRARVGPVEPADRHDRQLRAELEPGSGLRADRCGHPRVPVRVGRQGRDDGGARRRRVEQAAHAAASARATLRAALPGRAVALGRATGQLLAAEPA